MRDIIQVVFLDSETHVMLDRIYSYNYVLDIDISSINSSEFTLQISIEEADAYENSNVMKIGNLVYVDYPDSPITVDIACQFLGILRNYNRKEKKIEVDHFYKLFNDDSVPLQIAKNKTTLKNRLIYEWLPTVCNGITWGADGENFRYRPGDENRTVLNGHKPFLFNQTVSDELYGATDIYTLNRDEDSLQGEIVSKYLDDGAKTQHIVVTPRIDTPWRKATGFTQSFLSQNNLAEVEQVAYDNTQPCDILFTVGQFTDQKKRYDMDVNSWTPAWQDAKIFMICYHNGRYCLYMANLLVKGTKRNNPNRWIQTSTSASKSFKVAKASKGNGVNTYAEIGMEDRLCQRMAVLIDEKQAYHLWKNFMKYPMTQPDNPFYASGQKTVSEFDTTSYIWPNMKEDGWRWILVSSFNSFQFGLGNTGPSNTNALVFGFLDLPKVIDSNATYHKKDTLKKILNERKYFTGITIHTYAVTAPTGSTTPFLNTNTASQASIETAFSDQGTWKPVIAFSPNYVTNCQLTLHAHFHEYVHRILDVYDFMETEGMPILVFNNTWSWVSNIKVTINETPINAIYFYDNYEETKVKKKLSRFCRTHSRVYLQTDNSLIQVPNRSADIGTATELDIPQNVKLPLNIKHVIMTYDDTDEDESQDTESTRNLTEAEKFEQEYQYAKTELTGANDATLSIEVELYQNDYIQVRNLRIGMTGDITYEQKTYKNLLLTGINIDTSKSTYTLTFGAYRHTVPKLLSKKRQRQKGSSLDVVSSSGFSW